MSIKIYGWVPMIRMSDMRYPVYLSDFKSEYTNVSTGSFVYEEGMAEYGYYPVLEVAIPEGDVVTEGSPAQGEDGKWYKTWNTRKFTEEEIEENFRREKEQRVYSARSNFENENMSGFEIRGLNLSLDNSALTLYHSILVTSRLAEDGDLFHLMTQENTVLELSKNEAISEMENLICTYTKSYSRLCKYVKLLNAATTLDDLPEVPESFRS